LVKFKFLNSQDEDKVFMDLLRVGKVILRKEDDSKVFIAPRKSLEILDREHIRYQILEELEAYGAVQALRSAITRQVQ